MRGRSRPLGGQDGLHMRMASTVLLGTVVAALVVAAPAAAVTNVQIPGLQVALRARGLYLGQIDGIAGPMTVRGVRRFQRRAGLEVDGIAGRRTRAALGRLGRPLFGRRMLRRKAVGWDVSVLQFLLTRNGVPTGVIDGYFGGETARAVRRYQRRVRLTVDGVAGPRTMRALTLGRKRPRSRPRVRATSAASIRIGLKHWAAYYGIDPRLVRALAWIESGNQPNVRSPAGAWGVMQVMPATWRFVEDVLLGRSVPRTANGNIRVGVTYLHHLLHQFGGVRLALAAYHQGPAGVRRRGLYPETRVFVRNVLAVRRRL
jgi:peptidoglycan hydrolase-like protein with peptidoglycan-binding domain